MAQDPTDAAAATDTSAPAADATNEQKADDNANKGGYSFSSLLNDAKQAAKDAKDAAKAKADELLDKMDKIDKQTTDINELMKMAIEELTNYEKKLNALTDATEGKLNFLKPFATAKGVIFVHSWKAGVGLIGGAYGRGLFFAKSDAGWSLPYAVTKPEIKLGPQVATIEENQILLLSNAKSVANFTNDAAPTLTVGVDAFAAFGDKGQAVGTDDTTVATKDQKGYGLGGSVDFGTYREFQEANELFYGKNNCDKKRILNVSPTMDSSDLVKSIDNDKLELIKNFVDTLEGFIRAAQDEMAKHK